MQIQNLGYNDNINDNQNLIVSLPQVRLLEDDQRGQEFGSLCLYFWAQTIKLSLPHLRRTRMEEKHGLTRSNDPNLERGS